MDPEILSPTRSQTALAVSKKANSKAASRCAAAFGAFKGAVSRDPKQVTPRICKEHDRNMLDLDPCIPMIFLLVGCLFGVPIEIP